jgi:nitroreductase
MGYCSAMIHTLLSARRSGRAYDATKPVNKDDLAAILEAARWSPSGGNGQPWRFAFAHKGDALYPRLFDLLMPFNQSWAVHAPVLLLTATETMRTNQKGERVAHSSAHHDAGMANMSIAIEAQARGLMTHFLAGYHQDAARALLNSTDTSIEPVTMMTLGTALADLSGLSDELRARETAPRTRKSIDELLLKL